MSNKQYIIKADEVIFTTGSNSTNNIYFISGSIISASQFSGSFSGSFQGDGTALTGITGGGSIFALTGSKQNTTNDLEITGSLIVTGIVTSDTGFTGALTGNADTATTASYVTTAQTASYVEYTNVANKPTLVSASAQIDLSLATETASWSDNAISSSKVQLNAGVHAAEIRYILYTGDGNADTSTRVAPLEFDTGFAFTPNTDTLTVPNVVGTLLGNANTATTASYVTTAQTASYFAGVVTSASHAVNADSASYLDTAATYKDTAITFTTKRISTRVTSIASSATPTPDVSVEDELDITALGAAAEFAIPIGTPVAGDKLIIRIKDDTTIRALTWNAIYRAGTSIALPTTTVSGETMYIGFIYNATDTKWDLVALTEGH